MSAARCLWTRCLVASLALLPSLCAGASTGINVFGDPDELGTPSPDYGEYPEVTEGTTYKLTSPTVATNAAQTIAYRLKGWELKVNGVLAATNTAENVTNCTCVCTNAAEVMSLTWKWEVTHYKLDTSVAGQGSVDVAPQFVTTNGSVTINATPAAGWKFWKWTGDGVTAANRYRPSMTLTVDAAKSVTANFYDPAATARVVLYVVPGGAGTKDGTSWENACDSIATAYAKVAEYPCGDVWIKKGRHSLNSAIAIVPRIHVLGGFAGTETSADEADPAANPTIVSYKTYNRSTDTWGDAKTAMWTGDDKLTFVDPPERGDGVPCFDTNSTQGNGSAFENTDGALSEDNELSGLSFFLHSGHSVKLTTRNAATFAIRHCRFLACGWTMHGTDAPLWVSNIPVEVTDCDFIGCENTVRVIADTTVTTNVFERCRFYDNDINWNSKSSPPRAAGIAVGGTAYLRASACRFEKSKDVNYGSSGRAAALAFQNTVGGLVEDCVFCRSYVTKDCGAIVLEEPGGARFDFNRCRFERNIYAGGGIGAHACIGCCITGKGTGKLYANDSFFTENVVTNSTYDNPSASCVGAKGTWNGHYRNCTFEGNVSHGIGSVPRQTVTSAVAAHRWFAFVNCVFNNNRCGNTATNPYGQTEFMSPDYGYRDQSYAVINCVFANDDARYRAFGSNLSWDYDFSFASCLSSAPQNWGTKATGTFRYQPLDGETLAPLKDGLETNGVVVARGIAADSPFRRKGIPVFSDRDNDLYIYDTAYDKAKPWRLLRSPVTVYSEADGAARGLSRRNPIPDAFDRARNKLRTTLGPLDYRSGAAIHLR